MRLVHFIRIPGLLAALLCQLLLFDHGVRLDQFSFQENLEDPRIESGSRRDRIVLVAEVVPLGPLVDEDA